MSRGIAADKRVRPNGNPVAAPGTTGTGENVCPSAAARARPTLGSANVRRRRRDHRGISGG